MFIEMNSLAQSGLKGIPLHQRRSIDTLAFHRRISTYSKNVIEPLVARKWVNNTQILEKSNFSIQQTEHLAI